MDSVLVRYFVNNLLSTVTVNNWSVQANEDSDGHLNIYVTNSESEKLRDVEGDHNGDELHYRITTEEIEMKYRKEVSDE